VSVACGKTGKFLAMHGGLGLEALLANDDKFFSILKA
jgi:hypothetical protein